LLRGCRISDIAITEDRISSLVSAGADIIENEIPFSDPSADGLSIHKASYHVLQKDTTADICLKISKNIRKKISRFTNSYYDLFRIFY
jgi:tryptophan synthase alpha chain